MGALVTKRTNTDDIGLGNSQLTTIGKNRVHPDRQIAVPNGTGPQSREEVSRTVSTISRTEESQEAPPVPAGAGDASNTASEVRGDADLARLTLYGRVQISGFLLSFLLPLLVFVSEGSLSLSHASKDLRALDRQSKCVDTFVDATVLRITLALEIDMELQRWNMSNLDELNATIFSSSTVKEKGICVDELVELERSVRIQDSDTVDHFNIYGNVTTCLDRYMRLESDCLREGYLWKRTPAAQVLKYSVDNLDRKFLFKMNEPPNVTSGLEYDTSVLWWEGNLTMSALTTLSSTTSLTYVASSLRDYDDCVSISSSSSSSSSSNSHGQGADPEKCFQELRSLLRDTFHSSVEGLHRELTASIVIYPLVIAVSVLYSVVFATMASRHFRAKSEQLRLFCEICSDRSAQLFDEKARTERLVYQMLPKAIADQMKTGKKIETESFDNVTIYFSDVVGFNEVALSISPILIVDLLNALYGAFDECIEKYDAYKVETIADCYLMVSGLPERNGARHVTEIAAMALDMMKVAADYSLPDSLEALPLRIGINSGPIVAGVIGLKNTRYCLFGDTINTASRMLSTGEAYRIHTSEAFMNSLNRVGGFNFDPRGTINVKGKGSMKTFWLTSKKET